MRDQVRWGLVVGTWMTWTVVLLVGAVEVCVAGGRTVVPDPQSTARAESVEIVPGIVADGRLPAIFLMAPGGGIEAIDPGSGRLIWRSEVAARPLLVVGGLLVAQTEAADRTGSLSLVLLDARTGGGGDRRFEIALPEDVPPLIDQRLDASFSVHAWVDGSDVLVAWHYLEKEVTGVAPPPGAPPFRQRLSGVARVDVDAGCVTRAADGAEPPVQPLPEPVQRLVDNGELFWEPWRSGDILAATVDRDDGEGRRTVNLRRWRAESGEPLPEVVLLDGSAVAQVPSADRRHLMISSVLPARGADGERFLWSVFSVTTGEYLGSVRRHGSAPPFWVFEDLMVYESLPYGRRIGAGWTEQPLTLRAIDLDDGGEVWSRRVRDTAFRGGRPPGG